jgi:hypothetical protein
MTRPDILCIADNVNEFAVRPESLKDAREPHSCVLRGQISIIGEPKYPYVVGEDGGCALDCVRVMPKDDKLAESWSFIDFQTSSRSSIFRVHVR